MPACGEGLFSSRGSVATVDAGRIDDAPASVDARPPTPADVGSSEMSGTEPTVTSLDASSRDAGANHDADQPGTGMSSMTVKAGTSGVLEFEAARVMVRSMTFDENVQLTITVVEPPGPGPVGKTFQVQQTPIEAHASNALRFQVTLSSAQATAPNQYRLANFKPREPVGLWVAPTDQLYDAPTRTLTADFYGLDKGPVVFALLRACTDVSVCGPLQTCMAQLCQ